MITITNITLAIWCSVLTIIVVAVAVITDLRSRRIPNLLTFSAFGVALAVRTALQGWIGLGLTLSGTLLAIGLLLLLHAGRGIGMGDLKLAGAVGAIVGPIVGIAAVFASAIAGGVLAVVWMMRPGGMLAPVVSTFFIGLPFVKNKAQDDIKNETDAVKPSRVECMPYGLAIGVGSTLTLAACWLTGNEKWLLSFITTL